MAAFIFLRKKPLAAKRDSFITRTLKAACWELFYKLMLPGLDGKPKKKMRSPGTIAPAEQLNSAQVLSEFISQSAVKQTIIYKKRDLNKIKFPFPLPVHQTEMGGCAVILQPIFNATVAGSNEGGRVPVNRYCHC